MNNNENKKLKVGILTFHRAHNYGAVLQAYALRTFLNKHFNVETHFIDIKMQKSYEVYSVFVLRRFLTKRIWKELCLLPYRRKRYIAFENFIAQEFRNIPYDKSLDKHCDIIIVGSDQVWNAGLTKEAGSIFWGNLPSFHGKLISYAASMEICHLCYRQSDQIRKYLTRYYDISVREKQLKTILEPLTPKTISVCVDPTLLLQKSDWDKIAIHPKITEKYMLLYQVRNNKDTYLFAKQLAQRLGLKLVILSANIAKLNSAICIDAGPYEFLGWFKYASFVVSASFHGTVFSLIFQRPFYSIRLGDGKDSRVESLMSTLELEQFFISNKANPTIIDYKWDEIVKKLDDCKKESVAYLINNIN